MIAAPGTYYSKNREKILARYRANRQRLLSYQNAYNDRNVERLMLTGARDRAKTKGLPFDLTLEDIVIPDVCPVLGVPFSRGTSKNQSNYAPTLDKFIPALGYVRGNVHVISRLANMIKSSATTTQVQAVADWMKKVEAHASPDSAN